MTDRKDLSREQVDNIENLIIEVVQQAKRYRTISKEEYEAIQEFCVQGAAAISTIREFKKNYEELQAGIESLRAYKERLGI